VQQRALLAASACLLLALGCASTQPGRATSSEISPSAARARTSADSPCCDCRRLPPLSPSDAELVRVHVAGLLEALDERLALMPEVASYKFVNDLPVDAPDRERELLARVAAEAVRRGLHGASVAALFRAQIDVAKRIQRKRIASWREQQDTFVPAPADLALQIRPRIDAIGERILLELEALAEVPPCQTGCAAATLAPLYLTQPDLSASWRRAVIEPLGAACR